MGQLSEKQLLLLDNLMYANDIEKAGSSTKPISVKDFVGDLQKKSDNELKGILGGGFEKNENGYNGPAEFRKILKDIADDPALSDLKIEHVHKDTRTGSGAYSVATFVDKDKNATVAFRGTGPSAVAWLDNFLPTGNLTESQIQFSAADYLQGIQSESGYNAITVTGHSKGGNLAMFLATYPYTASLVNRCVSFDGQRFSEGYLEKYADSIADNKHKITAINAHNDFVSILLFSVAGKTIYVNNTKVDYPYGHYPSPLYFDNEFDGEGNFLLRDGKQNPFWRDVQVSLGTFVKLLPDTTEQHIMSALGLIVGNLLGEGDLNPLELLPDEHAPLHLTEPAEIYSAVVISLNLALALLVRSGLSAMAEKVKMDIEKLLFDMLRLGFLSVKISADIGNALISFFEKLKKSSAVIGKRITSSIAGAVAEKPIKINYTKLDQICAELKKFLKALDDIERIMASNEKVLDKQSGVSILAMKRNRAAIVEMIRVQRSEYQTWYSYFNGFRTDMKKAIAPMNSANFVTVEKGSIHKALKKIKGLMEDACKPLSMPPPVQSNSGTLPFASPNPVTAGFPDEEELKRRERNYQKIQDIQNHILPDTGRRLDRLLDKLDRIEKNHVEVFAETDREYAAKVASDCAKRDGKRHGPPPK